MAKHKIGMGLQIGGTAKRIRSAFSEWLESDRKQRRGRPSPQDAFDPDTPFDDSDEEERRGEQ